MQISNSADEETYFKVIYAKYFIYKCSCLANFSPKKRNLKHQEETQTQQKYFVSFYSTWDI